MKKKILDLGSGDGFKTSWLSKRNDVIGIDLSLNNIELARKRFPRLDFRIMDATSLKFEQDFFDQVFAFDILEHVDNLEAVIKEIKRVLKPEGELFVNIPYWKSEQWLNKVRPTYLEDMHHVRIFVENEIEDLFRATGFILAKKQRCGFLDHIFLYYMCKRKIKSNTQLSIGHWRDNWKTRILFISTFLFDKQLFRTPLKYCPVWVITVPIGIIINSAGNIFLPKSLFYKFTKT
ncbi:MAG: class I SAM-dependent methyltransferase [Candidatus Omnitrophica bacterium]|nr:class I SAM-dependent methyltransferase [Candidatus Omnitrophota bacterium]